MTELVGGFNTIAGNSSLNTIKNRLSAGEEVVVPSDLKFCKPKYGAPLLREPVKVRASSTSYISNGNNEIIVQLSNDGNYDFRRGYLTFDVQLSATGATYVRLAQGVWCIFYRMRTLLGFELENIQEYNRLFSLLWEALNDDRQSSVLALELMGIGTPLDRDIWGTQIKNYAMPLLSGFFDKDLLPLMMFTQIAELRLTMGDATTFVETDGTSPIVTITNFQFHCERISASSPFNVKVKSEIALSGLTLSFPTFQYYSQGLAAGSANLNSIFVNHKSASMLSILQVWTPQGTVNTTTVNDKFVTWPRLTDKHQFKIFGRFYPEEAVTYPAITAAEAYFTYLNWLTEEWQLSGELRGTPAPISNLEFTQGNEFIIILDVKGFPFDKEVINALGTENSTVQLQFDAYIPVALPVAYRSDFFVQYQRQIYINPQGVAVVTF